MDTINTIAIFILLIVHAWPYLIAPKIWEIRLLSYLVWCWLQRRTSRSSQARESRNDG